LVPVIAAEGVGLVIAGRAVLKDVHLAVGNGEVLAVLGPSGSGKSSLLRVLLGFAAPTSGEVRLGDEVVSRPGRVLVPPEQRGLAVVFQDLALWPHLTVRQHLEFVLTSARVSAAEQPRRIERSLGQVGLSGKDDRRPGELSGGERQRVAIARALIVRPRAVLLDEPLASLDVALRQELLSTFRALFRDAGLTGIFVTHDLREARALAASVLVIEEGRVVQTGTVDEVVAAPATRFVQALVDDVRGATPV
jgi:iron(III) transport system ATP-binding protein